MSKTKCKIVKKPNYFGFFYYGPFENSGYATATFCLSKYIIQHTHRYKQNICFPFCSFFFNRNCTKNLDLDSKDITIK